MYEARPQSLRHTVESIWEVDGVVAHTRSRHFPSGSVDLLINLGPPQHLTGQASVSRFGQGDAWLAGLQTRPVVIDSDPCVHIFGIRLRAAVASRVLGAPMAHVAGRVIRLDDLGIAATARLIAVVQRAHSFVERLNVCCRWIEDQLGSSATRPDYVQWMTTRIESARGRVPIGPLRLEAEVSSKKLAQDFTRRLGMTPKVLARIHRFRYARLVIQHPGRSLADTAALCGYFDQAHMTREFGELGGVTPSEYLAICYPDGNSGVVAGL